MNAPLKPDTGASALREPKPAPVFRAGLGRLMPPDCLRVGPLVSIPQVLRQFGIAPEAIMRQCGIPPEAFDHPDNALPFRAVCHFTSCCAQAIGREDFGLLVSEAVSPSNLGLVGFLMKQASSVRTAIEDLVRYFHHHDTGAVPFFRVENGMAVLGYAIIDDSTPGSAFVYDGAVAIICNILRALCGPKWAPIEVTLSHGRPAIPARYERHFGRPVRFNAEQSAVFFAESWLDRPIPAADPALYHMLEEQVRLMEETEGHGLAEKVRRLMRVALLSERGSVEHVAASLKMSKRTLERRLEEDGASFRALWDEIRYEVAKHMLRSTTNSITQIGLALKYSEASAFTRAFRKWSGMPPRAWRRHHTKPAGAGSIGSTL